jgi:tRNA threonylcarbamoyladenosine biosynthesis protein TsaE
MNTDTTWQTISTASEITEQLGEKLGAKLKGGELIELISDLGGGKTTFTRGVARGASSKDRVASPTFTISKFYKAERFDIHHFDFYRLTEAGIVADELAEVIHDPQAVVIVEWADIVHDVLPDGRLTITISQTPEGDRLITFKADPSLMYLMEAVQE